MYLRIKRKWHLREGPSNFLALVTRVNTFIKAHPALPEPARAALHRTIQHNSYMAHPHVLLYSGGKLLGKPHKTIFAVLLGELLGCWLRSKLGLGVTMYAVVCRDFQTLRFLIQH